jgi:nucleoid-associated protein YgaU
MFDPSSRYYRIDNATRQTADGRRVTYKRRRFPPPASVFQAQAVTPVKPGDRLDLIAARTLGDPLQFWRIADANDALNPFDLVESRRFLVVPAVRF